MKRVKRGTMIGLMFILMIVIVTGTSASRSSDPTLSSLFSAIC